MANIDNLEISIRPFDLTVRLGEKSKKPRVRGTVIVLPKLPVEEKKPHKTVTFMDVLEYVCQQIDPMGFRLSFVVEKHKGHNRLKALSLAKRFGRCPAGGAEVLSHTNNTEQIWQWSATKRAKKKPKHLNKTNLKKLNKIPIADLQFVELNFSVPPAQ